MNKKNLTELDQRLQCPKIILQRLFNKINVPKIFIKISLAEINRAQQLISQQKEKNK